MTKKPNYGFEKRKKELDKKTKQEEKRQRKRELAESERGSETSESPMADEALRNPPE